MATTYLTRTPSSGAATQKATFSFWVKKTNTTGTPNLFRMYTNAQQYVRIRFESSNKISFIIINSDSYVVQLVSTQVFRDTSAWYNIVCNMDTTQATASDRAKIYVNGERITAYDTATYPPTQNANITVTPSGTANHIGTQVGDSASYFEGCMSHINFTDGYVYQASEFGETDSTTGEWKIKTSPSVTYGTNGFFILKDGNSVTDQSGNSNNFTVAGGTLTNTEDCPDNVFATWNSLNYNLTAITLSNGNTKMNGTNNASYPNAITSLGIPKSGKWYAEFKQAGTQGFVLGIGDMPTFIDALRTDTTATIFTTGGSGVAIFRSAGDVIISGSDFNNVTPAFSSNDIAMIAYDPANGAIYFGRNGTWGSVGGVVGDPTSGASRTGAINISAQSWFTTSQEQGFLVGVASNGQYAIIEANFGNGTFGTTAVTSAGTNASGNGIFEYDVPTGYTALSTKGLNA